MIHEDNRRILEDWPEAKIITAKENCELGNHYHKIKTEKFILVQGKANLYLRKGDSEYSGKPMEIGKLYTIEPETMHTFFLENGSILIGLCSHPYDPTDDYKI